MLSRSIAAFMDGGYVYVGMDHFALPEDALAVAKRQGRLHRNFQGYSTQPDCDLIALGVSAIGKVGASYSQNAKTLEEYYDAIDAGHLPVVRGLALSRDDLVRRAVIMAIMCQGAVLFEPMEQAWLLGFREYFAPELAALQDLQAKGLVQISDEGFQVTPMGWYFVRGVAMLFDRYLQADKTGRGFRGSSRPHAVVAALDRFDHGARRRAPLPCHVRRALRRGHGAGQGTVQGGGQVVAVHGLQSRLWLRTALFHGGRLAGYASLGAASALAMESLSWLTSQTTALQPFWTLTHVAVMAWGLAMMVQARQPAWLESAGRAAWRRVQPWCPPLAARWRRGRRLCPADCCIRPCWSPRSAVAAHRPWRPLAWAAGCGWWPAWLWRLGRQRLNGLRAEWGTRLAGLMLVGVAVWALWMDLIYKPSLWCR